VASGVEACRAAPCAPAALSVGARLICHAPPRSRHRPAPSCPAHAAAAAAAAAPAAAFAAVYQATLIAPEAGEDIPRARQHEFAAVMVCAGLGAGWLAATASMLLWCPLAYEPRGWRIPRLLLPWMPSFAILLICFR
jgi:hypothetical protein